MTRQFTCGGCGHTFTAANTEAERDVEAIELHGPDCKDEMVSVCDTCHEKLLCHIAANKEREESVRASAMLKAMTS